MMPKVPRKCFFDTRDLRDYVANIDAEFFTNELAVRRHGVHCNVEHMVPEYVASGDTDELKHFGRGATAKLAALEYLDTIIKEEHRA